MFIPVKLTKHLILGKLAGIFDPVGAGAAVLVKTKIAMHELWELKLLVVFQLFAEFSIFVNNRIIRLLTVVANQLLINCLS